MPMGDGGAALTLLRNRPAMAIAGWGFIVRGNALSDSAIGGNCTLTCAQYKSSSIYKIEVEVGGPDWYIPFADRAARYCDVPRGQRDGTLVVTFPMNGCALEVHSTTDGNRFFHDSDGKSMVYDGVGQIKFRADYSTYAGPGETAHVRSERYFGPDKENAGGYEHTVVCVKVGAMWEVYASAIIRVEPEAWQIKDNVPYSLGSFAD